MSRKQIESIARKTAYKMIPRKLHTVDALDAGAGTISNSTPWVIIKPALIDQGYGNAVRATDTTFIEKCTGHFNVTFSTSTLNRVEIRELCGFYKGTTDSSGKSNAAFNTLTLQTALPNKIASWDRDNFLIKHDKSYDLMPVQIYDQGNDYPDLKALWRSKRIPLSLYMYRKYRYTNDSLGDEDGATVEGTFAANNDPVGWVPFIALQVRCPEQDFTGSTGNNAGPYIDYKFRTMFKDLQ